MSLNNKGNPYHDDEGKFTSGSNSASNSKKNENETENKIKEMGFSPDIKKFVDAKKKSVLEGDQGGYQDFSDFDLEGNIISRPLNTVSILENTGNFNPNSKIRAIKQFNDGHIEYDISENGDDSYITMIYNPQTKQHQIKNSDNNERLLKSTSDYADMVLSSDKYGNRFIQHYAGEGQKSFDDLRNERQQLLSNEKTDRLQTLKSEINNIAKQWALKNKNKSLTRDQNMALKTLLIDINNELMRRG